MRTVGLTFKSKKAAEPKAEKPKAEESKKAAEPKAEKPAE
jgi:hypothetical protein